MMVKSLGAMGYAFSKYLCIYQTDLSAGAYSPTRDITEHH